MVILARAIALQLDHSRHGETAPLIRGFLFCNFIGKATTLPPTTHVFNGYDYAPHIKTHEDRELFKRLTEIAPYLSKPVKECIEYVMEAAQIDRKLRRIKPIKFVFIDTSKSDLN